MLNEQETAGGPTGVFLNTEIPHHEPEHFLTPSSNHSIYPNQTTPKKGPIKLVSAKDDHILSPEAVTSQNLTEDEANELKDEIINPHKRLQEKRSSRLRTAKSFVPMPRKNTVNMELTESTQVRTAF